MPRRDRMGAHSEAGSAAPLPVPALWVAFVLSGAAGLIYESVWSRYLGLFVGHGAYAQVIVLVIFMGGMAAGALAVARLSGRIAHPLRAYAWIEAAAGVIGLLFHSAFIALTELAYRSWFPAIGESFTLQAVKWGIAGLLILPQSVLLGATFPLMTAGVVRSRPQQPGRVVALFYFANSLGAAAGVLAAGFWLAGVGGLRGTLVTAALLNLLVAAGVLWIARRGGATPIAASKIAVKPAGGPTPAAQMGHPTPPAILIGVSFGTAAASFIYEIAWVRMLSLVLGSATHSFELMLSAFILGLALGALWVHRRADHFTRPLEALAATQWAMGALALGTLPLYAWSFQWMVPIVRGLQGAPNGYEWFSLARYGICLAVMLPATFCAGITLPLITRILMRSGGEKAIGSVYGANTLGSILGAALAALALLPWLGLERLLAAGAALDIALGIALLAQTGPRPALRRAAVAALGGVLVIVAVLASVRLDPLHLVSGVYRTGELIGPKQSRVIYYQDGRTATISVRLQPDGSRTISTNGKADASLSAGWLHPDPSRPRQPFTDDESTQILIGVLSLVQAPRARTAAVVGLGSGMTSHVLLGSSRMTRVVTIEIEPSMITGAKLFLPANRRVFDDPRSRLVVDDARSYFAASREPFDLIVSEPSNPWVSGVSGLFTEEFYRRVKASLTPDGRLAQWLHLYSLDDDLVLSVLAAIQRHFADFEIFIVSSTDVLIVAGDRLDGHDWSVLEEPAMAADLAPALPLTAGQLAATWVADRETLAPLVDRARSNSDFMPILDLHAERARFHNTVANGLLRLQEDGQSLAAVRAPRVTPAELGPLERVQSIALERVPRLNALLENVHLRAGLAGHRVTVDSAEAARLSAAARRLEDVLTPPAGTDPHQWLENAIQSEEDLHRGSIGWVDEAFYDRVFSLARQGPRPALQALEWLRALEAHDWPRAAALTDSVIMASARAPRPWVHPSLVLGAGTTAKLAMGDLEGARRVYRACAVGEDPGPDLRTRLVHAWITDR
ncbi:MAG TPA: spermidine synthase [Candidatus Eisenbacteria bacterium]|nr:spermidine synthase [Candidatus Eisenbacteria bacterium]